MYLNDQEESVVYFLNLVLQNVNEYDMFDENDNYVFEKVKIYLLNKLSVDSIKEIYIEHFNEPTTTNFTKEQQLLIDIVNSDRFVDIYLDVMNKYPYIKIEQ